MVKLREIKLFQSLNDAELAKLAQLGSQCRYEEDSNVIIEGELSWGLYLILEGSVGVYRTNKLTGNQYEIGRFQANSFFGEMSLIDDQPRSATVRALQNSAFFFLSKEAFQKFLSQSPDLKFRFYSSCVSQLVQRLRELGDNYVISQYQLWQMALKKGAKEA